MNRVIPAVLLIYLFRRVLTWHSREFVRKKSRFRAIYIFPDASPATSENDDVSNWRNYDCLYLVWRTVLHTEERAIRDSCPRLFLSRRLFLETEISSANEPRIRNNSRGARWKISAASAFISREEFIILKFLRKYVLTLQAFFLHFSRREVCKFSPISK